MMWALVFVIGVTEGKTSFDSGLRYPDLLTCVGEAQTIQRRQEAEIDLVRTVERALKEARGRENSPAAAIDRASAEVWLAMLGAATSNRMAHRDTRRRMVEEVRAKGIDTTEKEPTFADVEVIEEVVKQHFDLAELDMPSLASLRSRVQDVATRLLFGGMEAPEGYLDDALRPVCLPARN